MGIATDESAAGGGSTDVEVDFRRAAIRNWVVRAMPTPSTISAPIKAAVKRAMATGMCPSAPKN